jgi:hypothetical protein
MYFHEKFQVPTVVALCVLPLCLVGISQPALARPADQIKRASNLPGTAATSNVPIQWNKNPQSIPAGGSTMTGVYQTWGGSVVNRKVWTGVSRTTVNMPPAEGVALMADWDGNGISTPGRYLNGTWFMTNTSVDSPSWSELRTFGGVEGDIPVTGNKDGDGKADIGVFRAGTWEWQLSKGGTLTETFGEAGDTPVVGDWNGIGADQPGVVRGNTWIVPKRNGAMRVFTFGAPGDLPVAGDWDGNGTSDPGVVRAGSTWFLGESVKKPKKTTRMTATLGQGMTPLVGSRVSAPGTCPTVTKAAGNKAAALVKKVSKPMTPNSTRKVAGYQEIYATLVDGVRYTMSNDLTQRISGRTFMRYFDPLSVAKTTEESIRRSANSALAASILVSSSNYKKENGISRSQIIDYARWNIRSIACQHTSLTQGGWGDSWQSALWAVTTAQAGWLLWPELSKAEKSYVASMIAAEADYVSERGPRYFQDRAGNDISAGDSKSDEVSWDLMAPSLARAMMPKHPHAKVWLEAGIAQSIAAFARPSDLQSTQMVNGVSIGVRLPGTNANEDGTVTNHGMVNPDYTQNVQHLWWAATTLRAAKQSVPEAYFLNADIVYRALAVVEFPSPPYEAPGGTVYQPGGQIYYPMGVGWGNRRPATFVGVDGFANVYAATDTNAASFLAAHAYDARALQLRFTDGRMYADGKAEDAYKLGKEEYALQQIALAWWAGAWLDRPGLRIDSSAYPNIRLDSGYPVFAR